MTILQSLISSLQIAGGFLVAGIILLLLFFMIAIYNSLMQLKNNIDKAWANIDVLLKKRLDLIPTLVDVVKGYTKYEGGVLEEITRIRASALQADQIPDKARGSDAVSASLKSIFVLAENYPDLKASDNFLHLQEEIAAIENQIAQRREFYNDAVLLFNTKLETIPSNAVAFLLRLRPSEYFRVDDRARTPVRISVEN